MRKYLILFLLLTFQIDAQEVDSIYWSYGCESYIYKFDIDKNEYAIYSKIAVSDKDNGSYYSYQMTTGNLTKQLGDLYALTSPDIQGETTVDFSDPDLAILKVEGQGQVGLLQCNSQNAEQLIAESEQHFKVCPKNVLNCNGL